MNVKKNARPLAVLHSSFQTATLHCTAKKKQNTGENEFKKGNKRQSQLTGPEPVKVRLAYGVARGLDEALGVERDHLRGQAVRVDDADVTEGVHGQRALI
jgi:hypothetical protein